MTKVEKWKKRVQEVGTCRPRMETRTIPGGYEQFLKRDWTRSCARLGALSSTPVATGIYQTRTDSLETFEVHDHS